MNASLSPVSIANAPIGSGSLPPNSLTREDILGLCPPAGRYNEGATAPDVHAKLAAAFPVASRNHKINCTAYDRVFITSDIHSDFRKFVQMLKLNNLIETPIDPYAGNDIYEPALITDTRWTGGSRTLVIIVGDLVDGVRSVGPVKSELDDPRGSFELLLFSFIYNLRLKANREDSEILFTIGNHEHLTVIEPIHPDKYYEYVADNAKLFFSGNLAFTPGPRQGALLPFLNTSPYYMLHVHKDDVPEFACVHGAFHTKRTGAPTLPTLEIFQTRLNSGLEHLHTISRALSNDIDGPIWSRAYGSAPGMCDRMITPFPLVIVGHCPTMMTSKPISIMSSRPDIYGGCDLGEPVLGTTYMDNVNQVGCIVMDCHDHSHTGDGGPKLAFVDVGMGQGMRFPDYDEPPHKVTPINNRDRLAQMLLLKHNPARAERRYFNEIHRVASTGHTGLTAAGGFPGLDTNTALYQADLKPVTAPTPALSAAAIDGVNRPSGGGRHRKNNRRTYRAKKGSSRLRSRSRLHTRRV